MAWLTGYTYRQKITINADAYISGNLTDFPVAVNIPSSNTNFWANVKADGTDVRFTDSDGTTLLKFEIESFDNTGDDAWYHVKVPTLSASADTIIYVYYGNAGASSGEDQVNTWDSNFSAVLHLNLDKAEGAFDDSTSNANDGTNSGTADIAGQIDRARDWSAGDYITLPTSASLKFGTGDFTVSFWFKINNTDANGILSYGDRYDSKGWTAYIGSGGAAKIIIDDSVTQVVVDDATNHADNTLHHCQMSMDRSGNAVIAVDGVQTVSTSISTANGDMDTTDHDDIEIGRVWYNASYGLSTQLAGVVDEVCISKGIARSVDWAMAEFRSGEGTWLTFGNEGVNILPSALTAAFTLPAPTVKSVYEDFNTYTETDPNSRISHDGVTATVTNMDLSEDAYLYVDKGVNYFSGDFEYDFDLVHNGQSADASLAGLCFTVANLVDDFNGIDVVGGDALAITVGRTTGTLNARIYEIDGGTLNLSSAVNGLVSGTTYYCTVQRDESVGTYGTLYFYVYTDAARINLFGSTSLALGSSKKDFRYLYAVQSRDINNPTTVSFTVSKLRKVTATRVKPSALTSSITLPAPTVAYGFTVLPSALTAAFTLPVLAVSGLIIVTVSPVIGAFTLLAPNIQQVGITPGALSGSFALPSPATSLPSIAIVNPVTGTFSILSPDVTESAILLGVSNFPQSNTVEYEIVDGNGVTVQAWTSVGVNEVQGPSKSAYYVKTNIVGSDFQGTIYWRTSDLAYEASEVFDAYQSSVRTLLQRLTATRASNLDNLDALISSRLATSGYTAPDNAGIAAIQAKTDNLPYGIKKNTALSNFTFQMIDSSDGKTGKAGLTITAQRSIDGAALAACANSVFEINNGIYKIDLAASDLNGDTISLFFTAIGAIDRQITIFTQT